MISTTIVRPEGKAVAIMPTCDSWRKAAQSRVVYGGIHPTIHYLTSVP